MLIVPSARLLVVKVAMPEELTVPVPTRVPPLKKLTVPVGVPLGVGETAAVKVIGCPTVPGLVIAFSVVVVDTGSGVTTTTRMAEVEFAYDAFPLNTAVILDDPIGRVLVLKVATPDEFIAPNPNRVVPLKNANEATSPFGTGDSVAVCAAGTRATEGANPGTGEIVAVMMTSVPTVDGLGAATRVIAGTILGFTVKVCGAEVEPANAALPE
jgi:hypothetical protein